MVWRIPREVCVFCGEIMKRSKKRKNKKELTASKKAKKWSGITPDAMFLQYGSHTPGKLP